MSKLFKLAATILVLLLQLSNASVSLAEEKLRLKIGGIYGLTGPLADLAIQCRNGALLAIENNNAKNSIKLEAVFEDSRWESKTAVSAFKKLVSIDKVEVVHVLGSPMTLAIKPLSEEKKVMLIAGAAHPQILTDSKLIIRHANSADTDARILAEAIVKKKPKRIVGLYMENDWAQSFDDNFRKYIKQLSNSQVITESHLPDQSDFKPILFKLTSGQPEIFVVNSFGSAAGLTIKQLREIGYHGEIYANNGLALSTDSIEILRDNNISGFKYQTYPEPPTAFVEAYKARFGIAPGIFSLITYTDYELIAKAAEETKSTDVDKLITFIKSLGEFKGSFEQISIGRNGDITLETIVKTYTSS